jgi:histidinol dehydrogenase
VLLTTSLPLAREVLRQLELQWPALSRNDILSLSVKSIRLMVVPDLDTALRVADDYAPEHLLIETRNPRELLGRVNNAGSVFLGEWSPEPVGDYCSGTNHVLPTYGYARAYSGLSVLDFVRRMTVQELTADGLRDLGPVAATLARLEGLDAHAAAVQIRLANLPAAVAAGAERR